MDEDNLSDAELWDKKRHEGMSEAAATTYVRARKNKALTTLSGAAQGATFGWADEILGGVDAANALLPKKLGGEGLPTSQLAARYRQGRDNVRAQTEGARAANPKTAFVSELAGGLATGLGGTAAKVPLSAGRAIGAGALAGGAGGLGTAEGDAQRQAVQTVFGTVAGGAMGGAFAKAPDAWRWLADVMNLRPAETYVAARATVPTAATVASRAARGASVTGGSRRGALPIAPFIAGAERTRAALTPDGIDQRALDKIAENLLRDGRDPAAVRAALAENRRVGGMKPEAVVDYGGKNTRDMAMAVQMRQGPGKEMVQGELQGRMVTQPERVKRDLRGALDVNEHTDPQALRQRHEAVREAHANENYPRAWEATPTVDDPEINRIFREVPQFRDAYEDVREMEAIRGNHLPPLVEQVAGPDGQPVEVWNHIPLQGLHLVKQYVREVAETGRGGRRIRDQHTGRALQSRLTPFTGRLHEGRAALAHAEQTYANDSRPLDAIDAAAEFMGADPQVLRRELVAMTPEARRAYVQTAYDKLHRAIDQAAPESDVTRRVYAHASSPAGTTKGESALRVDEMVTATDPSRLPALERNMGRERGFARVRNEVTVGSRTAPGLDAIEDTFGDVAGVGREVARGNPLALAQRVGSLFLQSRHIAFNDRLSEAVGRRLVAGIRDPQELDALLVQLEAAAERVRSRATVQRGVARGVGNVSGQGTAVRR